MGILSLIQTGVVILVATSLWRAYTHIRAISQAFKNIPGPPSSGNWLAGHIAYFFHRKKGFSFQREASSNYGQVVRLDGAFGVPYLFVFDPLALHHIVIEAQHIFEESPQFIAFNDIAFGKGLLATLGEQHRKQRKILNPVFSTQHMRHMLPIFYEVVERLHSALAVQVVEGPKTIDMLSWMTRATLEIVGQGGLGYAMDPLTSDVRNPFSDAITSIGPTVAPLFAPMVLLPYFIKIAPPGLRRWIVEWMPYWRIQSLRRSVDTLHTIATEIFKAKKDALEKCDEAVVQQIGEGKDIMSKLLQANMKASEEDRLQDEEVIAQISTLVFAATDTTSGALARILHLLAENPKVQSRLRDEILAELQETDGELPSYDRLHELPYLDAICRETLRLYPLLTNIFRIATKDAILPFGTPVRGRDGKLIHEVFVPEGAAVLVGILASNRNRALWGPDADEWKPDRWLEPLPEALIEAHIPGLYANLMTFLGGGRGCIGFKFSQLEIKVVLFTLIQHFKFSIASDIEAPIIWNAVPMPRPNLGYEGKKQALPLRVEAFRKED